MNAGGGGRGGMMVWSDVSSQHKCCICSTVFSGVQTCLSFVSTTFVAHCSIAGIPMWSINVTKRSGMW